MNDDFRDMMPTSEEFYADARAEFGEVVTGNKLVANLLDHTIGPITPEEQAQHERDYNRWLDEQQE